MRGAFRLLFKKTESDSRNRASLVLGLVLVPTCHRKQRILVIRNRPYNADSGLAVWSPQCQNSRSVGGGVILMTTVRRAWGLVLVHPIDDLGKGDFGTTMCGNSIAK